VTVDMDTQTLEQEIKELIISSLALEDISPEEINPTEPLFVKGLGLDSIDALELGLALQRKIWGVRVVRLGRNPSPLRERACAGCVRDGPACALMHACEILRNACYDQRRNPSTHC
jgi:acyl carrier protein